MRSSGGSSAQAQRPVRLGRLKRPLYSGCPVPTHNIRPQPARTRSITRREPPLTWKPLCLVDRSRPTRSQSRLGRLFIPGGHRFLKHSNHSPPVRSSAMECRCPAAGLQVSVLYHLAAPFRSDLGPSSIVLAIMRHFDSRLRVQVRPA
ncbi:hypothetical protein NDU88_002117 [Pleurodeles waltl]|uniref:Uncharacterized protein n=1 Tax=Pleurodeles waltl TaxID=8319 RepID=A0AAV7SC08_PLEWA|nr:hypothetical protein NDU88_002117 [Pleurodeles waltl]